MLECLAPQATRRPFVSYATVVFGWAYGARRDRAWRDDVNLKPLLRIKKSLLHAALDLN
jgi:hypothetical protein